MRTRRSRHPAAAVAALFLIVIAPRAGAGQESAPQEPLRLADLIADVLATHPEIAVAESRVRAASNRPAQELSLPDPMVSTGYAAAGRPYPGAGLGSDPNAQLSVMVSQEIPYPGKRQLRAELARQEADAERHLVDTARLALTARVKQAYYRLAAAHQLDAVLRQNEELLATLLKVSESRYAVGQAAQQDVIRTQTQLSLLAVQRTRIARERRTREGEINALLDRPLDAPLGRPADLTPVTLSRPLSTLVQLAIERSPMLQHEQSAVAIARAAIDVARRDFKPDFAVSGGYGYTGSMPDMFELRFAVVVPLQRARRRAAVAERHGRLAVAQHGVESARLGLQGRLQEDYQMAASASELATLYRDAVLPQARLALESSLASYQTGAVDFLSVLTNFGAVLEYEMGYVEQLADLHVAASRLEEMAAVTLLP